MGKMTKAISQTLKAPIPRTSKRRNKRMKDLIMRTIPRDSLIQALFRRLTKRAIPHARLPKYPRTTSPCALCLIRSRSRL
jgi:hypothetical protein